MFSALNTAELNKLQSPYVLLKASGVLSQMKAVFPTSIAGTCSC